MPFIARPAKLAASVMHGEFGMASDVQTAGNWNRSPVRYLMWGAAAFLLLLPAVAMQFTAEVRWTGSDFAVIGAMLAVACGLVELGARASASLAYRAGVVLAVGAGFLLTWANLAVGVVGHEGNPANLMFFGVVAIALVGSAAAWGRAKGMSLAMGAAALAQAAAHIVAYAADLGAEEPGTRGRVLLIGMAFAGLWAVSAACFRAAARKN